MSMQDIIMRYMPESFRGPKTQLITLSPDSNEYNEVVKYASHDMKKNIRKVVKVHNPLLFGWYIIRKAEYESRGYKNCEKTLLHVTAASNIPSIMASNLNWRRVLRYRFGRGVSFADDADYANKFAAYSIGSDRAMIVADVLVGKTCDGRFVNDLPPLGTDTAVGNNHVYVKFYDDEFYPKYIVYYDNYEGVRNKVRRFYY